MGIFLKDIQQFIAQTEAKQHKIVKEIVEEIHESVVMRSPIDTGNFISNWLIGIDKAVPWGVTGTKNADKDWNIARLNARIPMDAANHTYNVVNNSSYAQELEDGKSKQTGTGGMIAITTLRLPGIVNAVIARNKL